MRLRGNIELNVHPTLARTETFEIHDARLAAPALRPAAGALV
jgi:hypothetical protein